MLHVREYNIFYTLYGRNGPSRLGGQWRRTLKKVPLSITFYRRYITHQKYSNSTNYSRTADLNKTYLCQTRKIEGLL